jgi:hypothetical protein
MDQCPSHKRKLEHHNARLYCKKLLLEDRVEHFDAPAMLLREHTINVMVRQLELLVGFVTAIEERKVALAGNNLQLVKRNWEPSCLKEDVFTPFARAC